MIVEGIAGVGNRSRAIFTPRQLSFVLSLFVILMAIQFASECGLKKTPLLANL